MAPLRALGAVERSPSTYRRQIGGALPSASCSTTAITKAQESHEIDADI
jgi:hypothetical protein